MTADAKIIESTGERRLADLVFTGFNSRVVALDRFTGDIAWQWRSPKGRAQYVALLLDGDRLIVSVQGYMYCLDPLYGQQVWANPLKGLGVGTPSLASMRGMSDAGGAAADLAAKQAAAATTTAT